MKTYKISLKSILASATIVLLFSATSCVNDLEQTPIVDVTAETIYKDFSKYPSALAKLYGGYTLGGNENGNGGLADINGIDANFSQYTRQLFTLQELPTDEAVIAWNDGTLQSIHKMNWDSSSEFVGAFYYRIFTEIAFCNDFIRNTTDEKLATYNFSSNDIAEAKTMRAEARFLRALAYYHALDLFGNVPFPTETNMPIGSQTPPPRITRAELFKYVESELLACSNDLKTPKSAYGRADKAAAWSLLAKLYLNAQVYTGTARYSDCLTYCNKVIGAGYSPKKQIIKVQDPLYPNDPTKTIDKDVSYASLFLADNDKNNTEVIFPIVFDGLKTQTYGGTTYLVHAAIGGKMDAKSFGVGGGWGGLRTTKAYVNLFGSGDLRGNFYTTGQTLEINDLGNFSNGYAFVKYKNVTSTGAEGSDGPTKGSGNFCDADIPMFRLADIYLMYAEANLRGGGGDYTTALGYVNALRTRAGALPATSINLNSILDERGRELGWEMTRRTDLIRYGKFTTASYLWPWKGGVKDGQAVEDYRNLYPIPAKDIIANPNLVQNPGY